MSTFEGWHKETGGGWNQYLAYLTDKERTHFRNDQIAKGILDWRGLPKFRVKAFRHPKPWPWGFSDVDWTPEMQAMEFEQEISNGCEYI